MEEDVKLAPVKRKKAGTAATAIVCIIFGILAFAFSLCSAVQLIARNILEKLVVSETVSSMNPADWELGMFWDEKEIDDFVEEWYFPKTINENSTFAEALVDLSADVGTYIEVEDVEKMFEETGIMPALGNLLTPYERYLLTGNDEKIFSPEQIMNEIKKQHDSVQQSIGLDISIFYEFFEVMLEEVAPAFDEFAPANLLNNAGVYTSAAVGIPLIIGVMALSLAMFAIALVITKRFCACLRMYGFSLLFAGIVPIAAVPALPVLLREETMLHYNAVDYINKEFNAAFAPQFYTVGALFAGAGVVLIIVSIIGAVISDKRKAKIEKTEQTA